MKRTARSLVIAIGIATATTALGTTSAFAQDLLPTHSAILASAIPEGGVEPNAINAVYGYYATIDECAILGYELERRGQIIDYACFLRPGDAAAPLGKPWRLNVTYE